MDVIVTRSAAGVGLALVLLIGGWTSTRLGLDTADAVDLAMARRIDPDQAQREALAQTASYQNSEEFYQTRIDEAVERFELTAPTDARLREPNTFFHVASPGDPRSIAPGGSLREAGLELRIKVEEIEVDRRGIKTKNLHTLAVVRNVGRSPLAYFVQARSRAGDCQMRALTRYNAMALQPGESGELSICSGEHEVEIVDLRVMEVSEVGALWVSKVPPQAVGHDDLAGRSHFPGKGVELCAEIPAVEFSNQIHAGTVAWEDIVDFYSRHDCEFYNWWPAYRRATAPLERLPLVPE